jgi:hypothetical protein
MPSSLSAGDAHIFKELRRTNADYCFRFSILYHDLSLSHPSAEFRHHTLPAKPRYQIVFANPLIGRCKTQRE